MTKAYRQGTLYVVELPEIDWYLAAPKLPEIREEICKKYRNEARKHKCLHLVIFVTPDALFPLSENTSRHRVYNHSFVSAEQTYSFEWDLTCQIEPHVFDATDGKGQLQLVEVCAEKAKNTLKQANITKCNVAIYSGKTLLRRIKHV